MLIIWLQLVPICRVTADRRLLEASDFINSNKLLHATDSKASMLHGKSIIIVFYGIGNGIES